ncbi:hypothetical protein DACRYDRAFT_21728 [Dacryopinax primogenitus]|uniref:Uncharacterized protein n=1 Tax=Dacryopinax primogenitus (strain DJM 731) TaxID=1858805 RepID=M5GA15_DACPD|nr:uncharacterized protein DACRYDRAFT_21728 [Dacryopinax primogenitus]EJU02762.1 hypothetical protein DACRYDRAFT_21728 [Dacryopinax primogenitus]
MSRDSHRFGQCQVLAASFFHDYLVVILDRAVLVAQLSAANRIIDAQPRGLTHMATSTSIPMVHMLWQAEMWDEGSA